MCCLLLAETLRRLHAISRARNRSDFLLHKVHIGVFVAVFLVDPFLKSKKGGEFAVLSPNLTGETFDYVNCQHCIEFDHFFF